MYIVRIEFKDKKKKRSIFLNYAIPSAAYAGKLLNCMNDAAALDLHNLTYIRKNVTEAEIKKMRSPVFTIPEMERIKLFPFYHKLYSNMLKLNKRQRNNDTR
jgi:hypothetical protein